MKLSLYGEYKQVPTVTLNMSGNSWEMFRMQHETVYGYSNSNAIYSFIHNFNWLEGTCFENQEKLMWLI